MRTALIEELGQPPRLGEAAPPERRDGQALVEITAAPINPVDLSIAAGGFYMGKIPRCRTCRASRGSGACSRRRASRRGHVSTWRPTAAAAVRGASPSAWPSTSRR